MVKMSKPVRLTGLEIRDSSSARVSMLSVLIRVPYNRGSAPRLSGGPSARRAVAP